ncbi:uncharacterized protein FIBRA_04294 [Fibroporia radiculosa]|uniref:Uncharacterized protein n=1 Tax=Fibroporia radiculosa TaxID=599839 RepID=J4H2W1_9APHY|nr:uncharacterized protein FIBRA_04294 [Fibroporia radiculosa]CCM02214.1 predicted protein [Fibroporia radiculosa]
MSLAERKPLYETDSFRGSTYKHGFYPTDSYASLTPGSSVGSRQASVIGEDTTADNLSTLGRPLIADTLPLPNPPFNSHSSSYSVTSPDPAEVPPSLSIPLSDASSASYVASMSGAPYNSRTTARALQRSQSRPTSMASSVGTVQSTQSRRSVLRGPPHSIHSNIQIVLPAPLAPEAFPYPPSIDGTNSARSSSYTSDTDSPRQSVHVDQWVPVGMRSASMSGVGPAAPSRSRSARGSTNPRIPSSLSQSTTAPSSRSLDRRSQSQPRMGTGPRSQVSPVEAQMPPPPVPHVSDAHQHPSASPRRDGDSSGGGQQDMSGQTDTMRRLLDALTIEDPRATMAIHASGYSHTTQAGERRPSGSTDAGI